MILRVSAKLHVETFTPEFVADTRSQTTDDGRQPAKMVIRHGNNWPSVWFRKVICLKTTVRKENGNGTKTLSETPRTLYLGGVAKAKRLKKHQSGAKSVNFHKRPRLEANFSLFKFSNFSIPGPVSLPINSFEK